MKDKQKVYILIGAPGSGKSSWSKSFINDFPDTIELSTDAYRAKLGTGEEDQSVSAQAFAAVKKDMGIELDNGKDVIIDACSMYRKSRKDFINIARGRSSSIHAIVFLCDKETLMERNKRRGEMGGRNVPESIIDRMISRYQEPTLDEGIDTIEFI